MDASWVQVGEAVIMPIATGIGGYYLRALMDRRQNQRDRLQLITTRWAPNGLRLEINYQSQSAHTAIEAKIVTPADGIRLIPGRPVINPAPMLDGGHIRFEFDGQLIGKEGVVRLRPFGGESLKAVMFLLPDGSGEWVLRNADVELTVSEAGGKRLVRRRLCVSPIEEAANTVFALPAPLHPPALG